MISSFLFQAAGVWGQHQHPVCAHHHLLQHHGGPAGRQLLLLHHREQPRLRPAPGRGSLPKQNMLINPQNPWKGLPRPSKNTFCRQRRSRFYSSTSSIWNDFMAKADPCIPRPSLADSEGSVTSVPLSHPQWITTSVMWVLLGSPTDRCAAARDAAMCTVLQRE